MKTPQFSFIDFRKSGEVFLTNLVAQLEEKGIPAASFEADHLCFRVASSDEYCFFRAQLSFHGKLLTEAAVNRRPICTFRLHDPFQTDNHVVKLVELPAPKPGTSYASGFEHAEFLIKECFDSFSTKFPHLRWKPSGKNALNPELCLRLGSQQAKFHHHSLERIIEIENAHIQHVIFDFDGTLVNSRESIDEVNRIVFSQVLEREVSFQESVDNFHPEFSKLFEAFGLTCPTKRAEAISIWGSVSQQFSYGLFEGVADLLHGLRDQGLHLHLWTARDEESARKILHDHRIESLFSTLSFATNEHCKPNVKSLRFDWNSATGNQILVVGDSPADIFGSRNLGAIGGAALWDPRTKKGPLVAAGAELFFEELSQLKAWLTEKNTNSGES